MSEIAQKVKSIIIDKLGVEESEVTPEASFTNDLGADSLDTVELIMEFEKEFNISIPDDQAENISTVGQAISCFGNCRFGASRNNNINFSESKVIEAINNCICSRSTC